MRLKRTALLPKMDLFSIKAAPPISSNSEISRYRVMTSFSIEKTVMALMTHLSGEIKARFKQSRLS